MVEERLIEILNNIKSDIDEISSRYTNVISTVNMTLDSAKDDIIALPSYISTLQDSLQNLQNSVKELEEKIMITQQSFDTVTTEIEIAKTNKNDLEATENNKRNQKNSLETNTEQYQERKIQLEAKLAELVETLKRKEDDSNRLETVAKEEISSIDHKILETTSKLELAKKDNRLIVYLMESGILDVPEAEIVSVVSSNPNGLTLAQIKEKVNMAPVRVQPTINTLLEKVIEYNSQTDTYKILESIKSEFS